MQIATKQSTQMKNISHNLLSEYLCILFIVFEDLIHFTLVESVVLSFLSVQRSMAEFKRVPSMELKQCHIINAWMSEA
jgi:hypothetical protein